MAERIKVLFVDDEESIRITLPPVLHSHGFDVTTAASVTEALGLIMQYRFNVLIADLNIGRPGDGFTVVSAMRNTQPDALRFILTGYPDFESALEAIRQEVHDYLVKPTETTALVQKIRSHLGKTPQLPASIERKRLPQFISENRKSILEKWMDLAKQDPALASLPLTAPDGREAALEWLDGVIESSNKKHEIQQESDLAAKPALAGYSVPLLLHASTLLQAAIGSYIQDNLLAIDVSHLVPDLVRVFAAIQETLEENTSGGRPAKAPKKKTLRG